MSTPHPYPAAPLVPSASLAEAVRAHWREYMMEGTEIGALMLSICMCGTLLYSSESPLQYLDLSRALRSILMGTAISMTTFLITQSPFGRRSGAHCNPAVTLTFFWLARIHRWDAACYIMAQFAGAVAGVLAARAILGVPLSAPLYGTSSRCQGSMEASSHLPLNTL